MDHRIEDIQESERPRERLERSGVGSLSDAELLALVIRTGCRGKNVLELSHEILGKYSVRQLSNRSIDELKEFEGISSVKAGQIAALGELSRRMVRSDKESLENLSDVKEAVQDMKSLESEILRAFYLNSGNEVLRREEFGGETDSVSFSLKRLLKPAVTCDSTAIIVAHNHPSGSSRPTSRDITATEQLRESGEKLGIDLLDHVVVGREIASMRNCTDIWN